MKQEFQDDEWETIVTEKPEEIVESAALEQMVSAQPGQPQEQQVGVKELENVKVDQACCTVLAPNAGFKAVVDSSQASRVQVTAEVYGNP
jgi:hypothetical protein